MARSERTTNAIEDALNAAQVEFSVNPLFMAPQTKQVLQAQERMFDEAEKFWSAWFQRRQDATQSECHSVSLSYHWTQLTAATASLPRVEEDTIPRGADSGVRSMSGHNAR